DRLRPSILPARCLIPGPTSATSTRAILACGSGRDALGVAQDEVEIAGVDEEPGALAQDKDGITAPERVEQEGQAAADRKIPEAAGHNALAQAFGRDPLDEEARGEEGLPKKADAEPNLVRGHVTPSSWRSIVRRSRRRAGRERGVTGITRRG